MKNTNNHANEIMLQLNGLQEYSRNIGVQLTAPTLAAFCLFKFACDNAEILEINIDKFRSFSTMAMLYGSVSDKAELINSCLDIERELSLTNCSPSTYIEQFLSKILKADDIAMILHHVANMNLSDEYRSGIVADALCSCIIRYDSEYMKGAYGTYPDIAQLMIELVSPESKRNVYDGCCGMGQCLYELRKANPEIEIHGQDINFDCVTIATILQILSFSKRGLYTLKVEDTLAKAINPKKPTPSKYDAVIMAPPVRLLQEAPQTTDDSLFVYGKHANKRSELMFLLHAVASLNNGGVGVIHLPAGALFAGGKVEAIRKSLIDNGHIGAVISLPQGCYVGTGTPSALIIFGTENQYKDVLFIDGSKTEEYFAKKSFGRTFITHEGIEKLLKLVHERTESEGISSIHKFEDIAEKGYLLTPEVYLKASDEVRPEYTPIAQLHSSEKGLMEEFSALCKEFDQLLPSP